MNNEITYVTGVASDFSPEIVKKFKEIVINAGEVRESSFDGLIRKNPTLMFIPDADEMSAVGALKIPNDTHKNRVFEKSNSLENPEDFDFEIGWIVSRMEGKGYGKKIVEVLMDVTSNLYATVRIDNIKMKGIFVKYGFIKSGDAFPSDKGDHFIELYILKNK